jgi:nucleotide-binding universal stress UspA family protein
MNGIKKILAPTDLTELSLEGLRYALEVARTTGAEVIVYLVVCLDEFTRYELSHVRPQLLDTFLQGYRLQLSGFLDQHFARVLPLVELRQEVEPGIPEESIVAKAKAEDADLIVISTHGRSGLSQIVTGSVTENVVRHASCPVLSIRPRAEEKHVKEAA